MLWLTNRTVLPPRATSPFCQDTYSGTPHPPRLSTSSTSSISGSRCAATANASRTYIPLEYRFTGVSMNFSTSAKRHDLVELATDLGAAHAKDRAIEINVLAPRELGMEASADFEQARHAAADARRGPRSAP